MNNLVLVVSFSVYSISIALANSVYLSNLLPLVWLGILYWNHFSFRAFFYLNIFVFFIFLSLWFYDSKEAILIAMRSNVIFVFFLLALAWRDQFIYIEVCNFLKLPSKVSAIVFFFLKTILYLKQELFKINLCIQARGFSPKMNLFTYKTYAISVALLIIKTIIRGQTIQKTIHSRGFLAKPQEVSYNFNELDFRYLVLLGLVLIAVFIKVGKIV